MNFPLKSFNAVIIEENSVPIQANESALSKSSSTKKSDTAVPSPGHKKRFKLFIDESTLPKEEAERLLVKRAYNRGCAERARKRSKDMVKELHRQVEELHADKNELRRTLATMKKEICMLKEKNNALTSNRFAQVADKYSHHNVGMNTVSPLNIYSPQQPFSALSLLPSPSHHGDGCHEHIGSLLSSWDYQKLLLLQQLRK